MSHTPIVSEAPADLRPKDESLQAARARIARLEQDLLEHRVSAQQALRDKKEMVDLMTRQREELRQKRAEREAVDQEIARAEDELGTLKQELGTLQAHNASIQDRLVELSRVVATTEALRAEVGDASMSTGLDLAAAEKELRRLHKLNDRLRAQLASNGGQLQASEADLQVARDEAVQARQHADQARAIAEAAQEKAGTWGDHAAAQTVRADQLEGFLRKIQARARQEVGQREEAGPVSPGSTFLTGLAELGLGAALRTFGKPSVRRT